MHEEVKSCVIINTNWFGIDVGLRQGCVLSPILFLIFINDLLRELKEAGLGVVSETQVSNLAFADDIALLANTKEDLQTLLRIAEKYAQKWKFAFNTKKCKVMVFNRVGENPDTFLEGDRLEVVKAYKYLGVWFDTNLTWRLHKATILAKAKRRAYTMMGFGVCKILPAASCINLWEVLVRPILEYAGEVWGDGLWEEAEKLQRVVFWSSDSRSPPLVQLTRSS